MDNRHDSLFKNIKLLRKYIPDKLFAESNLPQVHVIDNGIDRGTEDPSLVISSAGYIPGKPTYRIYEAEEGSFIPLVNSRFKDAIRPIITSITYGNNQLYECMYSENINSSKIKIDEYDYVLKKILNNTTNDVKLCALSAVRLLRFKCSPDSLRAARQQRHIAENTRWLFYSRAKSNVMVDPQHHPLHRPFYAYLDKSDAFPRFSLLTPKEERGEPKNICRLFNALTSNVDNAFYGIYAVDVYALLKGKYRVTTSSSTSDRGSGWCEVTIDEDNKGQYFNDDCFITGEGGCRRKMYFVKVLVDGSPDLWNPVMLGYEIRNTKMLILDVGDFVKEAIKGIGSLINNAENAANLADKYRIEYRILSLNTAVANLIRHYISHDLAVLYYLTCLGFTRIEEYINLSILVNDLFLDRNLVNILRSKGNNTESIAKEIVNDYIRQFSGDVIRRSYVSLLRYMLSTVRGERLEGFRMFHVHQNVCGSSDEDELWNRIQERVKHVLDKYSNDIPETFNVRQSDEKQELKPDTLLYAGLIIDVIKHTLSHHLIRTVSARWSTDPSKFIEYYNEMSSNTEVSVMERDTGGIGILDEVFNSWTSTDRVKRQELVEDLILSLGKCLVGTPEDIIHFALIDDDIRTHLCTNKDNDIREAIRETISKLGIVITPDEFEETVRLWRSLYEEAERLTRVLPNKGQYQNIDKACKLLEEVHKLRYELEQRIGRFPEMNELIAYVLRNITNKSILNNVLQTLLERGLRTDNDARDILHNIYHRVNNYIERFINDLWFILNQRIASPDRLNDTVSNHDINALRFIIRCIDMRARYNNECSRNERRALIRVLKLVGRILRAVLMRISLLSCNGACGMCYVNTRSCSRFGAPFIQARTLDRRVLKIIASEVVEKRGKEVGDYYDLNKSVDVIVELGGKTYSLRCS